MAARDPIAPATAGSSRKRPAACGFSSGPVRVERKEDQTSSANSLGRLGRSHIALLSNTTLAASSSSACRSHRPHRSPMSQTSLNAADGNLSTTERSCASISCLACSANSSGTSIRPVSMTVTVTPKTTPEKGIMARCGVIKRAYCTTSSSILANPRSRRQGR